MRRTFKDSHSPAVGDNNYFDLLISVIEKELKEAKEKNKGKCSVFIFSKGQDSNCLSEMANNPKLPMVI